MLSRDRITQFYLHFQTNTYALFNYYVLEGLLRQMNPPKSHHSLLMRVLKEYGLTLNPKAGGVCAWLAAMSVNAFYCEDMNIFTKRLDFLCDDPGAVPKIKQAKQTIAEGQAITEVQYALVDTAAFLESEKLFMEPENHAALLTAKESAVFTQQDADKFISLVAGEKLRKRGGLVKISCFSGLYRHGNEHSELTSYFFTIRESLNRFIEKNGSAFLLPGIAFELSSGNHAITVIFDIKNNNWAFIDINQLPPRIITDEQELANLVFKGFEFGSGDFTIFATRPLVPADAESKVKEFMAELKTADSFKKLHAVTACVFRSERTLFPA